MLRSGAGEQCVSVGALKVELVAIFERNGDNVAVKWQPPSLRSGGSAARIVSSIRLVAVPMPRRHETQRRRRKSNRFAGALAPTRKCIVRSVSALQAFCVEVS